MVRNTRFLCTSRLIGEPLTLHALQGSVGTAHIIKAHFLTSVLSKIELSGIPVQVFGADMLVGADHAALKHAEKALKGVHMDRPGFGLARIFADAVVHAFMLFDTAREFVVLRAIGMQGAIRVHVLVNRLHDLRTGRGIAENDSLLATATFNKAQDANLVLVAGTLAGVLGVGQERLIGFHNLPLPANRSLALAGSHGFPNTVRQEPSGFHAAIEHPLNLAGRNAFLAGAHEVDDLKPQVQGKVAGLENGPHAHGKGLAAAIALVEAGTSGFARKLPHGLATAAVAYYQYRRGR